MSAKRISHSVTRSELTWILYRSDDELEAIRVGAPVVGEVLQRDVICVGEQHAHSLLRVATGDVHLELPLENQVRQWTVCVCNYLRLTGRMTTVVNVQMIVTV
jgi:hypothetical protein